MKRVVVNHFSDHISCLIHRFDKKNRKKISTESLRVTHALRQLKEFCISATKIRK